MTNEQRRRLTVASRGELIWIIDELCGKGIEEGEKVLDEVLYALNARRRADALAQMKWLEVRG